MGKRSWWTMRLALSLALAAWPGQALSQTPSFQGLGQMPGSMPGGGTYVNAVSGDGTTIVGRAVFTNSAGTGSEDHAFRWTAAGGYEDLGSLGGHDAVAYAVSFGGTTVVGQSRDATNTPRAFRWREGIGMDVLPFYEARGSSADGSVVVGMEQRWTAPGQTEPLGYLGGNNSTYAMGVTGDGQVVVGVSETSPSRYNHAFRWTPAGGLQDLGVTTGTESIAWGVSADGSLVYGEARDAGQFWRAFRWTSSLGMRDMGTLGGPMSTSHGASANGRVIVGKSLITSSSGSLRAFRWTSAGMRDLRQELLNAGVTAVQSWTLAVAADVSDDGTVFVGWGYPASLQPAQPFRAVLPNTTTGVDEAATSRTTQLSVVPNPVGAAGAWLSVAAQGSGSSAGKAHIGLHALDGRLIRTLELGDDTGARWDGRDGSGRLVPNGVYFLRLALEGRTVASTRLVVAR